MKVYFLQLLLTKKCNQKCPHCNVYSMTGEESTPIVDIDFLKYVLDLLPDNSMIEFCGGEPGLVQNLNDVFETVYSHNKVKLVQVMSNGLVRLKGYSFIEEKNVRYREHLISHIEGKTVHKFYNSLQFKYFPQWRYVIVTEENTIKSLHSNFDFFKNEGFFEDIFWYKILNPKTGGIHNFLGLLNAFFIKLKTLNHPDSEFSLGRISILNDLDKSDPTRQRLCGLNSPTPSIDFETKELIHCGSYLEHSTRVLFTRESFERHLKCSLFRHRWYCDSCYIYMENRSKSILDCFKNKPYNLEV